MIDPPPSIAASPELEALCVRNLLAVPEVRVFFKDRDSRFLLVSQGWLDAVGRGMTLEEVLGRTDADFFTPRHAQAALADEQRILVTGEPIIDKLERETFVDRPDAWVSTSRWPLHDADGSVVGTFGVSRDVSAQMRDPATGLANRLALMERLRLGLESLERQPGRLALLFLDVDGFKQINDTYGHRVGDSVLAQLAERLTRVSRRFDTVARYGGDEFVMVCSALHASDNLTRIGERIMRAVCLPLEGIAHDMRVTASVGAVVCADPFIDPDALLEHGDRAMYAAKRAGGGRLAICDYDARPGAA
jgi:diguanylate cyclase (GGDEF)-like protein/PAS domain S-box-containing protein